MKEAPPGQATPLDVTEDEDEWGSESSDPSVADGSDKNIQSHGHGGGAACRKNEDDPESSCALMEIPTLALEMDALKEQTLLPSE